MSDFFKIIFILEVFDDTKNNLKNYLKINIKIREIVRTLETKRQIVKNTANTGNFDKEDVNKKDDSNIKKKDK